MDRGVFFGTISFILAFGISSMYFNSKNKTIVEEKLDTAPLLWLDSKCNVHINRGVRYERAECLKELRK